MLLYGCRGFSVVLVGSCSFSVVFVDSQLFPVVLPVGSRMFSMFFCRISMVLGGSRSVSVVLCCPHRFS